MRESKRRAWLARGLSAGAALMAAPWWGGTLHAQPRAPAAPGAAPVVPKLKMLIPANPGGGWDGTGRAIGAAMQAARLVGEVEYENKGGRGGLVGLPYFIEKYDKDPHALMVGGMVMVGSIALNRPPVDLSRVVPLARLTGDYLVVAVPKASTYTSLKALVDDLKRDPKAVPISGGSAGGIDHMLAGMMLRELGRNPSDVNYLPFASGSDTMKALADGRAKVAISGYSEFKDAIAGGELRALGISAGRSLYNIPSLGSSGVRLELSNWRGLFAPAGISDAQRETLRDIVLRATESPEWKASLQKNSWEPKYQDGAPFRQFVEQEQTLARVIIHLLGIKT